MSLHRYIVKPESAWGTPLRSDTLAGLLLYRLAEDEGEDALRAEISAFMDGRPPFVLSSAMPKDTVFAPKLPPLPRKRFADLLEKGAFVGEKGKLFSAFEALSLFKKYRKKRFLPLSVWQRHCKSLSVADLFAEFCKNPGLWETPVAKRQQEMHVTISRNSSRDSNLRCTDAAEKPAEEESAECDAAEETISRNSSHGSNLRC